jgi:amino acid transporter
MILSAISLWQEDYVPNQWQTVMCFWGQFPPFIRDELQVNDSVILTKSAVMLICMSVNIFGSKYLDLINKACLYWTGSTVIITTVALMATADRDKRHNAEYVFTHFDASASGWPSGWAFFIGLLQAAYTLTGYGMVAAMCEEVQQPQKEVPRAMVLSVAAAGATGLVFLIPILFVLPDVKVLLSVANGQPMGLLFKLVTGSTLGGFGLLFLLLGVLFFAGVGALTAASRCTYAFARDGAIPGSRVWSKVNGRYDIPLYGLTLSTAVCCLLGLIYFGSSAAFNSFTGVATICLSTSYASPVLISVLRGRKFVKNSPFSLGKFGYLINMVTICWIVLAVVLFCMPVALPVQPATMSKFPGSWWVLKIDEWILMTRIDYASVVFAGFTSISAGWYWIRGRKAFTGPPLVMMEGYNGNGQTSESDKEGIEFHEAPGRGKNT